MKVKGYDEHDNPIWVKDDYEEKKIEIKEKVKAVIEDIIEKKLKPKPKYKRKK